MKEPTTRFSMLSRLLHWLMAGLILAMLFIGVGMAATPDRYHGLVVIHRPLGVAILVLAAVRVINRLIHPAPNLPQAMPSYLKWVAKLSHLALYVFMIVVPLTGWAMLSAGAYPVALFGAVHLPPIFPHNLVAFAALRRIHGLFAILFFLTFVAHLSAALLHALVFRDGVFQSMASLGPTKPSV